MTTTQAHEFVESLQNRSNEKPRNVLGHFGFLWTALLLRGTACRSAVVIKAGVVGCLT